MGDHVEVLKDSIIDIVGKAERVIEVRGIVLTYILRRNSVGQRYAKNFRLCAPHPYATTADAPTLQESNNPIFLLLCLCCVLFKNFKH